MALISLQNVTKIYHHEHMVLHNVSLDIEKGDIYGILGLSGAGKSTLIRCINGLEKINGGEIYFNGELLCSSLKPVSRDNKRKIGMIFQGFNLLEQLDVLDNVMLGLEFYHDPDKKTKAIDAIKKVGLEDKIHYYPSELSGGQKQRVAIARVLALNPSVILSDEATSALDTETTISILDLLKSLNEEFGLTIIMISHQLSAVEHICNKVAILDKGEIVESGKILDVFLKPKSEIAKTLIYSNQMNTVLEKGMIRVIFDGNSDEPVIANMIKELGILVSVVYADTKTIEGKLYGQSVVKLPNRTKDIKVFRKYLNEHNIDFVEVE